MSYARQEVRPIKTIMLGIVDGDRYGGEADHQEGGWMISWSSIAGSGVVVDRCRKWCG